MEHQESRCYPTGCEPCDVPINFPDSPVDGDRYCVDAKGYANGQKCWVYDKCIPGWRAEGPNTSPAAVYRGAINIKTEKPGANIEAGHFYVQTVDVAAPYQPEWGLDISDPTVLANNRIAFNGQKWEVLPGPIVPYASEATEGLPLDANDNKVADPDPRLGGIVKNATVEQAIAGVNKCDTITPYTLQKKFDEDLVDFTPTKPDPNGGVVVSINQGPDFAQCITNTTLVLSAGGTATATDGSTAIGRWKYQWSENGVNLREVRVETVSGGSTDTLTIEDFEITPTTGTRTFKITATFTDLFGDETTAEDTVNVTLTNATSITTQPSEVDLTSGTTGSMTVATTPVDATLPAPALTYKWYVNNVEITGATTPNIGYTFANFTTATLGVTRTAGDAGTYSVYCEVTGGCQGMLVSETVFLKGPGGEDGATIIQPPPGTDLYSVGSYSTLAWTTGPGPWGNQGWANLGNTITYDTRYGIVPPNYKPGTWRVMGYIYGDNPTNYPGNLPITTVLIVRIS